MAKDPWMIDPNDGNEVAKGMKAGSFGKLCPKLNKDILGIEKPCKVCEAIRPLWGFPKGSKERELANDKKAKVNFYFAVCFKDKPDKAYILETGKKVGNNLIDAHKKGKWLDVAHPKKGLGRDLTITKGVDGGYNTYKLFPELEKAGWDVPEDVLNNLPNLDKLVELVQDGLSNVDNYFNVSRMKVGETITFRLLPSHPDAKVFNKRMAYLWRHWGVTDAEINGEVPLDLSFRPEDSGETGGVSWSDAVDKAAVDGANDSKEPCFGNPNCFNETDEDCLKCKVFKKCMKVVKGS